MCCECGMLIEPNPANICVACLRNQVDITEGIPKQALLYFCPSCERYVLSSHLYTHTHPCNGPFPGLLR